MGLFESFEEINKFLNSEQKLSWLSPVDLEYYGTIQKDQIVLLNYIKVEEFALISTRDYMNLRSSWSSVLKSQAYRHNPHFCYKNITISLLRSYENSISSNNESNRKLLHFEDDGKFVFELIFVKNLYFVLNKIQEHLPMIRAKVSNIQQNLSVYNNVYTSEVYHIISKISL